MTVKPVLCVGRVYCDLVFKGTPLPSWGHEVFANEFASAAGGGAFITAAYLTALGHSASLAGNAGSADPFGAIVSSGLAACNIDGAGLRTGTRPQVTVAVAGAQDRAFLSFRDPAPITVPHLSSFRHLHVGELATLVECPELIDFARSEGATISSDCGDESTYPASVQELIGKLDVFLPSASEWSALNAVNLVDMLPAATVVKRGANGARAYVDGIWHEQAAFPAKVRDTTGAGDAFNAGFLSAWLGGQSVADSLQLGTVCGAAAVEHLGGWGGRGAIHALRKRTYAN